MLPTTDDINAAFVTDNSLEHEQEQEENVLNDNGKGNNEFESNITEEIEETADNVDNVENLEVVNDGEEVIDNLNEYSSISTLSSSSASSASANNADGENDREQEYNEELLDKDNSVDVAEADIETFNTNLSGIRNKEREDVYSSDDEDEDTEANATEMHPTFNDEWGNLNEADKYDVISNAISEEEDNENFNGKPYDLSHDIDVNNAANLPINPDAVYIDGYSPAGYMPRFEKLSLDNSPPTK